MNITKNLFEIAKKLQKKVELLSEDDLLTKLETIGECAEKIGKSDEIITFAIVAKFIATLFLLSYFFFKNPIWMVLISGIGDFLMGVVLLVIFHNYKKNIHAQKE